MNSINQRLLPLLMQQVEKKQRALLQQWQCCVDDTQRQGLYARYLRQSHLLAEYRWLAKQLQKGESDVKCFVMYWVNAFAV